MAYTTVEGRQELLDALATASNELGTAVAALGEAYEQLDEQTADRLEGELFRPIQLAYGRAKRTHNEFAQRHGLDPTDFAAQSPGLASQGAHALIDRATASVATADAELAELQDSMLPIEVGDEEVRAGITDVRATLTPLAIRARELLRVLGR